MITQRLFRSALHEHAEPAQRVLGAARLAPDSAELAQLLAADPAPEVRAAAAGRCIDLTALGAALQNESDTAVRTALDIALGKLLAETQDSAGAQALLEAAHCTDAIRAEVTRRTPDAQRRRIAIAGICDEGSLVALALSAEHAQTRKAAAERVRTPEALRQLADAARNKDRGVARHARQRAAAIQDRASQEIEADAILAEMEALPLRAGPILKPAIELERRWRVLDLAGDTARLARWDAAEVVLRERFDREQDEQRSRALFERSLRELSDALGPHTAPEALPDLRAKHTALQAQAQTAGDEAALARLAQAQSRMALLEQGLQALAGAEAQAVALVDEADELASGTFIDNANLPQRWQALDRSIRIPALTRRFEAALLAIEKRRLAQVRATQQQADAAHERVQGLLNAAELALATGHLHAARAAYDETVALKATAPLAKPVVQRLGHIAQQLAELERWESFGQRNARIQLCERAEALAAQAAEPSPNASRLAADVRKLRGEWKALDQQHAGVPKSLWTRFDSACEKAYAPAAQHFAQQAALNKQARKQRETFIAAAASHVATLLAAPRDLRTIEHWLRDTERVWRDGDLGSVEPGAWKKLDTRLRTTLAPLRELLSAARGSAKSGRQQLIAEVAAVAANAERDAPAQVKAIQARWQEQAKAQPLPHREEQALWEQFRAGCDAVFSARKTERKQEDERKHEGRRALEQLCLQLEQLALDTDQDDKDVRRVLFEVQEQWSKAAAGGDPALRGIETRFRKAKAGVDAMLSARVRARDAAVWQTLAAKERLCDELDAMVFAGTDAAAAATRTAAVEQQWAALPALPPAWEKQVLARRDAALQALSDPAAGDNYYFQIEDGVESRRERLADLEMTLGLNTPAEFQAQRLALQVKKLRDRFKSAPAAGAGSAGESLLAWCAQPGVAEAGDRQRVERLLARIAQAPG